MKIGLETESYHLFFHNNRMDIFDFIRKTAELGLDGVQINIITNEADKNLHPEWGVLGGNEPDHLKKVREEIQKYGLYAEIDTRGTDIEHLTKVIDIANQIGADVIRTYVVGKYDAEKMAKAAEDLKQVVPLLKKYRIKLGLENHEEETTDEIIKVIKEVNSPWVGAHCDIGNGMMAWEDPVEAVRNLAPYAYTTHFKDHIIIHDGEDHIVCGIPVGNGNIDLEECFKILVDESTLTRINIEMCYPYVAPFTRPKGTGGVFEVGEGAFKVEQPPYDLHVIKPADYYYPPEHLLEKMLEDQEKGVQQSVKYVLALREKYCGQKNFNEITR
jgi:sugar phosphate isomerase/epimerase